MDLGIIIALKEEFREFFDLVKQSCEVVRDESTGNYFYTFERPSANPSRPYQCVVTFAGGMGPTKAALTTKAVIDRWSPATIVNMGIAGGMSNDVVLGDVVVATVVDSYMEHSKAVEGTSEQTFEFQIGGEPFRCSGDLVKAAQNLEFGHARNFQNWLDDCIASLDTFIPEPVKRKLFKASLLRPQTSLHEGHIASGVTVGAATAFSLWLKTHRDRNFLGLEMEAGGVMAAVFENIDPRRSLVIRGISDLADKRKSDLDKIKGGAIRRYAMQNAIRLLWRLLEAGLFPFSDPVIPYNNQSDVSKYTLPTQLSSFVGRTGEIAHIKTALSTSRLVTLTGTGGVGKSRLALQVAKEMEASFANGAQFVELASLADPELLVQTVASILNVRTVPGTDLIKTLEEHLRPMSMLLVLDNCEHLLKACTQLTSHLLRACPLLRILATSREWLHIPEEQPYPLSPLSLPSSDHFLSLDNLEQVEAVGLFIERAKAVQNAFTLNNDNAGAIVEICRRLDGVPLAIVLAAAHVRAISIKTIQEELEKRGIHLLRNGSRIAPPRHQTLEALIDWSYDQLSGQERRLFLNLAVFAGGWTLASAEVVCGGNGIQSQEILHLLMALFDKSLVVVEQNGESKRYRFLETIRQYAKERFVNTTQAQDVQENHLMWCISIAEEAEMHHMVSDQAEWLNLLETEHDNLRAALNWCLVRNGDRQEGIRLAGALGRFWEIRGYFSEGREMIQRQLESKPINTLVAAKAMNWAGTLTLQKGDYNDAEELHLKSLSVYNQLNDGNNIDIRDGIAECYIYLGNVADDKGDYELAERQYRKCLVICQELGDKKGIAHCFNNFGVLALHQDQHEDARNWYFQALEIQRQLGNSLGIAQSLHNLGRVNILLGENHTALMNLEESQDIYNSLGDQLGVAGCLDGRANLASIQGDNKSMDALRQQSNEIYSRIHAR